MALPTGRLRSASHRAHDELLSPVTSSALDRLRVLIQNASLSTNVSSAEEIDSISNIFYEVRMILVDTSHKHDTVKTEFRQYGGFEACVKAMNTISSSTGLLDISLAETGRAFFGSIKSVLDVLSEALFENPANNDYFIIQKDQNRWLTLHDSLGRIMSIEGMDPRHKANIITRLFGMLFALSVREDDASELFSSSRPQGSNQAGEADSRKSSITVKLTVKLPEALAMIVRLWKEILLSDSNLVNIASSVIDGLVVICESSEYNLVLAHRSHILNDCLAAAMLPGISPGLKLSLDILCTYLIKLGLNGSERSASVFRAALASDVGRSILFKGLTSSKNPAHIVFDLSVYGHSSVEINSIPAEFPPQEPAKGYTFACWLRIDSFDELVHTTIFGIFDETQTCFNLLYLERDTRHLVMQTSVTASRPSVRFKSKVFEPKEWYFISIVHLRAGPAKSSRALLFIDGKLVEKVQCHYPGRPPWEADSPRYKRTRQRSEGRRRARLQAFFGTPQDLSPRVGANLLNLKWALANARLMAEALPEELLVVYHSLGPDYSGNFQDCLGSFQTYAASARLNLLNERLHVQDEDHSIIARAIRGKAAKLNPEHNLVWHLSPRSFSAEASHSTLPTEEQVHAVLPHLEQQNAMDGLLRYPQIAHACNRAPQRKTILGASSAGIIAGAVLPYVPAGLDDLSWRLCGCIPLTLKLLMDASGPQDLQQGLALALELLRQNWRNSEAFERQNGFALLASVLGSKISSKIDLYRSTNNHASPQCSLLRTLLIFVGYKTGNPSESAIDNPLAYKSLLIDSDIWRTGDQQTQKLYYEQFVVFIKDSRHRQFNVRRLTRMRVARKLIDSMSHVANAPFAFPPLLQALKVCLHSTASAEVFRTLALYITTATASLETAKSTQGSSDDNLSARGTAVAGSRQMDNAFKSELGVLALDVLREVFDEDLSKTHLKKFARTVTIKWLLNLLVLESARIVRATVHILALLLDSHPIAYTESFAERSNGFEVLKTMLPRWWFIGSVWHDCFALMFGVEVAKTNELQDRFDGTWLRRSLEPIEKLSIPRPYMLGILVAMLKSGVSHLSRSINQTEPDEPEITTLEKPEDNLLSILSFILDLHKSSESFRDFAVISELVKDMMGALYAPLLVSTVPLRSTMNLRNALSQAQGIAVDAGMRDLQLKADTPKDMVGKVAMSQAPARPKSSGRRRLSSFVMVEHQQDLIQTQRTNVDPRPASSAYPGTEALDVVPHRRLADILVSVFADQVLNRKDYTGLGLFLKAPPSPWGARSHVNGMLMSMTALHLEQYTLNAPHVLKEPRILINLARFVSQGYEAFIEGWYDNGHAALVRLSTVLLTIVEQHELYDVKSVRLCRSSLLEIRNVLMRALTVYLSHADFPVVAIASVDLLPSIKALNKYWLEENGQDYDAAGPLFYVLSRFLRISQSECVGMPNNLISPAESEVLATYVSHLSTLMEGEDLPQVDMIVAFLDHLQDPSETENPWLEEEGVEFDHALDSCRDALLMPFVAQQREISSKALSIRQVRRAERLESWHLQDIALSHVLTEYLSSAHRWIDNIRSSERIKYVRSHKDQVEALEYMQSQAIERMQSARFPKTGDEARLNVTWQLDATEARDRMRLRLSPLTDTDGSKYEPKSTRVLRRSTVRKQTLVKTNMTGSNALAIADKVDRNNDLQPEASSGVTPDDFELIADPSAEEDDDKNRRVLRSLEKGEEVKNVYNVARVIGLDAQEGLLIVGRKCLYLIEGLFQRSDGEILNRWEAPMSERDRYAHIVSGHAIDMQRSAKGMKRGQTLHWRWADIISFSKRGFLTRPVALEVFFSDGLSLLLTTPDQQRRDALHSEVLGRTSDLKAKTPSEASSVILRTEMLKAPTESTSRFSSMFAPAFSKPITKRWSRGELSNFQYLILINTMAGRTFNDITQYPIFPWVLADYTSDELDLTNPRSYRDLTKPMGCQSIERAEAFRDRYASFAEMDETTPAFHYGTHYSSAMIVTSFLIRLEPYVRSHVLFQAGSFDHADRLFYSIGKAWLSASKETLSDVRELIPEFFYLPDFLTNVNGYDFGIREINKERVNDVELPPWAKGSPSIFIQKHREALESPHVSQNLHSWIDLVFGFKQQGEAALEATNVFHYLSYAGSKDLDTIQDQHERAATVGILHNFGLTPSQVFQRPHDRRETHVSQSSRLHKMFGTMHQLPTPTDDLGMTVTAIASSRQVRAVGSDSLLIPTHPDLRMEWGFYDQSVAFIHMESSQLRARLEQLHQDDILAAVATESGTVITASQDSTITAWKLRVTANDVDLHHMTSLFDHEKPVNALCVSETFVTLLSASVDGKVLLWDLNRLSLIREIQCPSTVDTLLMSSVTGNILIQLGDSIRVYTLNGTQLIHDQVYAAQDDVLTCVSFYEPADNLWIEHDVVLTGTAQGRIDIWATIAHPTGIWKLDHLHSLDRGPSHPRHATNSRVTCIRAAGQKLHVGYANGKVFEYLPHK